MLRNAVVCNVGRTTTRVFYSVKSDTVFCINDLWLRQRVSPCPVRPRGGVELFSPGWGCGSGDAGCNVQSEGARARGAVYHTSRGLRLTMESGRGCSSNRARKHARQNLLCERQVLLYECRFQHHKTSRCYRPNSRMCLVIITWRIRKHLKWI